MFLVASTKLLSENKRILPSLAQARFMGTEGCSSHSTVLPDSPHCSEKQQLTLANVLSKAHQLIPVTLSCTPSNPK